MSTKTAIRVVDAAVLKTFRTVALPKNFNKSNTKFVSTINGKVFGITPLKYKDGKGGYTVKYNKHNNLIYGLNPYYLLACKFQNNGWTSIVKNGDLYQIYNPFISDKLVSVTVDTTNKSITITNGTVTFDTLVKLFEDVEDLSNYLIDQQ